MTKTRFLMIMSFSGLLLAGCAGANEPELSILDDEQAQVEVPAYVTEHGEGELENITYVGEGDDFRVYAARDREDNWCVVLYNVPLESNPDDWHISSNCGASEAFTEGRVWVQGGAQGRIHTAQLLPDNFTGETEPDLERINDNLAAK